MNTLLSKLSSLVAVVFLITLSSNATPNKLKKANTNREHHPNSLVIGESNHRNKRIFSIKNKQVGTSEELVIDDIKLSPSKAIDEVIVNSFQANANYLSNYIPLKNEGVSENFMAAPINIKVCYNADQYGIGGSQLSFADDKLLNLSNFGPSGTVTKYQFTLFNYGTTAVSAANLIANGCQIFYMGGTNSDAGSFTATSTFAAAELTAIKDWAVTKDHVLIAFQGHAAYMGGSAYTGTSGNSNPNTLTTLGQAVISGPFGSVGNFNQGGGYQGKFTTFPTTACVITQENTAKPTGLLNNLTGDFYFADFDILSQLGGLTTTTAITSNTDKLFANLFYSAAELLTTNPANPCNFFLCPAGSVAPVLTASTVGGTGVPVNLNTLYTGTPPVETTLTWHNATPVSDENYIGNATNYTKSGTVYAAFRANDGSCYSPSSPVVVSISSPDLSVSISPATITSAEGQTQAYTVTVTNNGPINAPNASVKVTIPTGRKLVVATPSQGTYSSTSELWNLGNLASGASATMGITLRVQ